MGITEFQQQDDDPLRGPFPDHLDEMVGTAGQTAVLGGTHNPIQIAPGNGLYGVRRLIKITFKGSHSGTEVIPDDGAARFIDEWIDIRKIADAAGDYYPLSIQFHPIRFFLFQLLDNAGQ